MDLRLECMDVGGEQPWTLQLLDHPSWLEESWERREVGETQRLGLAARKSGTAQGTHYEMAFNAH